MSYTHEEVPIYIGAVIDTILAEGEDGAAVIRTLLTPVQDENGRVVFTDPDFA